MRLLFLLLFLIANSAFALSGFIANNSPPATCYSTRDAACAANNYVAAGLGAYHYVSLGGSDGTYCHAVKTPDSDGGVNVATSTCSKTCAATQVLGTSGACECPVGKEIYNGVCVAACAANQTRNATTGQCEGPCTASQFAAAKAGFVNSPVIVNTVPVSAGLRMVTEKDDTSYICSNTCKVQRVFHIRIGTITSVNYQIKDWTENVVAQEGCDNLPASSTKSWDVAIGQKPEGGCQPGFVYGEVNGVAGCYGNGAPGGNGANSGAAAGGGGGGPQNHPDNPGGDDGKGNGADGKNQNGDGGACAAGYHDVDGVCKKDASGGGGDGNSTTGTSSGGDDCSALPDCSGDEIMCNVLKQSWQQKCQLPELNHLDIRSAINAVGGDPNGSELVQEVDVSEQMQSIFNVTGGSASCPADIPITLAVGSFNISWAPFCTVAVDLRPLVLFLFGFMATRIYMAQGAS